MSLIKFELTKDHIKLLKHTRWDEIIDGIIISKGETPFDGFNHYEDIGIIIYGKPKDDFDIEVDHPFVWSDEQKEYMDKLLNELPTALEVVLNSQSFEVGKYKARYHIREWSKIKNK